MQAPEMGNWQTGVNSVSVFSVYQQILQSISLAVQGAIEACGKLSCELPAADGHQSSSLHSLHITLGVHESR